MSVETTDGDTVRLRARHAVPVERLRHAVPAFPTISEVWLRLLETRRDS